jgi:creatinine amidohydrolase
MKIRFGDMRWPEIEEVLKKPNVVLLPVGSTEQHGRHLPVNFDTCCVEVYAEQVAEKMVDEHDIHVLVAPAISYGEAVGSPPFKNLLPGTITIKPSTLISLVEDVVRSLVDQGFRNILVLNGHLENTGPISVALRNVTIEFKDHDLGLFATSCLALAREKWSEICKGGRTAQGHAGERETAVALAIEPENVDLSFEYEGSHASSLPPKWTMPLSRGIVFFHSRVGGVRDSGIHVENPCVATKEIGEEIVAAVVDELIEIVVGISKSEGIQHKEQL